MPFCKSNDVGEIVVGLPLRLSGAEGTQSEKMRVFADELHAKFACLCISGMSAGPQPRPIACSAKPISPLPSVGQAVDRIAAVLILQAWLAARSSGLSPEDGIPEIIRKEQSA